MSRAYQMIPEPASPLLAHKSWPLASSQSQVALCGGRFAYTEGDGKNLVEHYGHRLRHELIAQWETGPLPGSEQGVKSPEVGGLISCPIKPACSHDAAHPALHIHALPASQPELMVSHC